MPSPVHPYSDYGVALRTLRAARGWLAWLLAVCVVTQMVGFTMMRYTQQPYKAMKPAMEPEQATNFGMLQRRINPTTAPAAESRPAGTQAAATDKTMKPAMEPEQGMNFGMLQRRINPTTAPATESSAAGTQTATTATSAPATSPATTVPTTIAAATNPAESDYLPPVSAEGRRLNVREQWNATYVMAVAATQVGGLLTAASQTLIVFLTLLVILVAQAPGVAHVTKALIWTVLLLFMVMPWQFFARGFPVPGLLYGYNELLRLIGPQVVGDPVNGFERIMLVGRFVLYPLLGLFVLLVLSERFRAGLMLAIGHPLLSMMQMRPPAGPGVMGARSDAPGALPKDKK